jgi:hypothetical protein
MTDLSKMNNLINKLSDAPFQFGKNDCYTFTARLVKEWHGKDFTKNHAVYETDAEAAEYTNQYGGIEALTTGTLGYPCLPTDCRDGDVVSAYVGTGVAVGFVFKGNGLFKSKKVLKLPLSKCHMGWRVK